MDHTTEPDRRNGVLDEGARRGGNARVATGGADVFSRRDDHEHILVVDDEKSVRSILKAYLETEGYRCEAVDSGEEALRVFEERDYDLVISDIMMPGMSGIELLKKLQSRHPDTAVIMLTARGSRDIAVKALKSGAYGYITKPFKRDEILINVLNALERRWLRMQGKNYARQLERKVREQTRELRNSREEICLRLIQASQFHHDETAAHIRRIGRSAQLIARHMNLPEDKAELMRLAAAMHDVGKIGVPNSILNKPDKLTGGEWDVMKTHTTMGGRIMGASSIPILQLAHQVAVFHHERWDGRGYPNELRGSESPIAARIVGVLDVYDALVHDRVYRPALPEEEALEMVAAGRQAHFDPEVCDAFFEKLPEIQQIRENIPTETDASPVSEARDRGPEDA